MNEIIKPIILCVDDEPTNLKFLMEILKDEFQVYLSPSGQRALAFLEKKKPDVILLDVEMPKMNGYEVIRQIKSVKQWVDIPIIFLTGLEGRDNEQNAFKLGAVDYILKPISSGVVLARTRLHVELMSYRKRLEELVKVRTEQLECTQNCILNMLANVTSYRDSETGGHIKRTTYYVEAVVNLLFEKQIEGYRIDKNYGESMITSAKLHDIGKVAVPDSILLKPGRLTEEEFEMIKHHTIYGVQLLDNAKEELKETASFLDVAREIILGHHERWDGSGYPHGVSGKNIPLSARIMAIADVYDALISRRPYKEPFSHELAIQIILEDAVTHFDPELIEICKPIFSEFEKIAKQHIDEISVDFFHLHEL